jgi:hypothetical protein
MTRSSLDRRIVALALAGLCSAACGRGDPAGASTSGASDPASTEPAVTSETAAAPPAASGLHDRCDDFVGFTFGCGIGKPARDPTLDIATQQNNDLIIRQAVADRCRAGQLPYDEGLIRCFLAAGDDCDRYRTCADGVVAARRSGQAPPP